MAIKLKKGINPVGTSLLVRMQVKAAYTWHKYSVLEVTGDATNTPNQDTPIIWMELAEKNPGTLQQFISLPLSVFPQRVMPNEAGDKFWEEGKGDGLEVVTPKRYLYGEAFEVDEKEEQ